MSNLISPANITTAHKTKIRESLQRLGAIKSQNVEVFSNNTRDNKNLTVYRDKVSKVIFIDEYYIGDDEYQSGKYRSQPKSLVKLTGRDYEDVMDSERRFNSYRQFIVGKTICDFGCGAGSFLRLSAPLAKSVCGIELQQDFAEALNKDGLLCFQNIEQLSIEQDSMFLFHCLEHLPDPINALNAIYKTLKQGGEGRVVIEVPHARDFLLDKLKIQAFADFTLWSQHLVLHTRESLTLMLLDAGFKNIYIEGIQRYSVANHLHWLKEGKPGGHKDYLSILETEDLVSSYSATLSKIDANDTIVAIATT